MSFISLSDFRFTGATGGLLAGRLGVEELGARIPFGTHPHFGADAPFGTPALFRAPAPFGALLTFFVGGIMTKGGKLGYLLVEAKHKNNPININLLVALKKPVDVGSALVVLHGSFRRDTPTMVQKLNIKGPNSRATFSYSGAER